MILQHFLEDIYDDNIRHININHVIDFKASTLLYDKLFADAKVLNSLLFIFVWKGIFDTYPSRLDITIAKRQIKVVTGMDTITNYITSATFVKYLKNYVESKSQSLKESYYHYSQKLHKDISFVRFELLFKLRERYNYNEAIKEHTSLYQAYMQIIKSASVMTNLTRFINPINGFELQQNVPSIDISSAFSPSDIAKYCVLSDHYFLRSLFMNHLLIVYDEQPNNELIMSIISAVKHRTILLANTSAIQQLQTHPNLSKANVLLYPISSVTVRDTHKMIPAIVDQCTIVDLDGKCTDFPCKSLQSLTRNYYITSFKHTPATELPYLQTNIIKVHDTRETLTHNDTHTLKHNDMLYSNYPSSDILNHPEFHKAYLDNFFNMHQSHKHTNYQYVLNYLTKYCLKNNIGTSISAAASINHQLRRNCILLVDNRMNIMSVLSCLLAIHNVDNSWDIIISTPTHNQAYYSTFVQNAKFINHPMQYMATFDIEHYNIIMKDHTFWKQLELYNKCLIIQDDAFLLRKGIDQFMQYDYVGAPWSPTHFENKILASVSNPQMVGNGGFSLRSIPAMLNVTKTCEREKTYLFNNDLSPIPEDVYFAKCCYALNYDIPDAQTASKFACEQVPNKHALGVHKLWAYHQLPVIIDYFESLFVIT